MSSTAPYRSQSDQTLHRALTRISGAPVRTGNALALLRNGPATFDDWLAAIAKAQRWVHLENYMFKADEIGQRFADALVERARAGVPVRVLYDWFGSLDVPGSFWDKLRESGVDVRVVNSPGRGVPLQVINRDHRKFVGVDGSYASLGGVCIDDDWLQRSPVTGLPYRDTAVRVTGPAIADLERAFADVWDRMGSPLPPAERPDLVTLAPAGDMSVRVVAEEPGRMRMLNVLQLALAVAQERLWIADAYFLVVPTLRVALLTAARDGLDVRILLPSSNDLPVVGALSRAGYRPFLEAGVRIWEYAGLMMHAKTTVGDGCWSRIGSTNLNITGLLTNWELDILVEDCGFGAEMEAMYEEDLAHSREIRLAGSRRRPRPTRPENQAERVARRDRGSGSGPAVAALARAGAALQTTGNVDLDRHERTVAAAIGGSILGVSLLSARFPRLLAWPLSVLGSLFGGLGLLRALRRAPFEVEPRKRRPRRTRSRNSNGRRRGWRRP